MDKQHDLELILRSRVPIIVIETHDEARMLDLLKTIAVSSGADAYLPLFRWSITDGLQRLDISLEPQLQNSDPSEVLKHIKAVNKPGIYVLLDFHPYLDDPVNVRLLKDICIRYGEVARQIILVSHNVKSPRELESFSARFDLALPTEAERKNIVKNVAREYAAEKWRRRNHRDDRFPLRRTPETLAVNSGNRELFGLDIMQARYSIM